MVYRHEESAFVGAVEYLFKHDVLREVSYESVIKRLRKTYHGLVADWLIANCGDRLVEYSGLIAEHSLIAGKKDVARDYFERAGISALSSYANQEAESYFRHALNLSPIESQEADLLAGLGKALYKQGKSKETVQNWLKAIEIYSKLGDYHNIGDIYARLSLLLWYTDDYITARDLCLEGLKLLEDKPDSVGYARLLAEGGRTALWGGMYDQVTHLCQEAIHMANRVGNLEILTEASITLALREEDPEECINLLKETAEIAEANHLIRIAWRANNNIGATLNDIYFDLNSSRMYALRALRLAQSIGDVESVIFGMDNILNIYISLGEFKTVESEISALLRSSNVPETRVKKFLDENRPLILFYRGEWFDALYAYRKTLDDMHQGDSLQKLGEKKMQIAYIILELNRFGYYDDLSEAEQFLSTNVEDNLSPDASFPGLVFVYIQQGRLKEAYDHYSRTKKHLAQAEKRGTFPKYFRPWIEFQIACVEGCWEDAISISESMIEMFIQGGYQYQFARQLINLGDALNGRNKSGDKIRAQETYQQSLDMFTEMGAPGYIKVLEERLVDL